MGCPYLGNLHDMTNNVVNLNTYQSQLTTMNGCYKPAEPAEKLAIPVRCRPNSFCTSLMAA